MGKDTVARFGEIHPHVLENYDIEEKVYVAEIYFEKLVRYGKRNKKYTPIPKYPAIERDIAVIIDEDIEVGAIQKILEKRAGKILESAKIFDIYRDEKLGENKKSVAYSLKFRDQEKTLTDEEINGIMSDIITDLETGLEAVLRK